MFNVVPKVFKTVLNSFSSLFCSEQLFCTNSSFWLTYPFFCLLFCNLFFLVIFHFSYCIVHHSLFFSSSRSLLNISCISSILFPSFWIIFTIITLNSFSGILSISSSFIWSWDFLPCLFICNIFVFPFCLTCSAWGLPSTGCRVIVLLVSGICPR